MDGDDTPGPHRLWIWALGLVLVGAVAAAVLLFVLPEHRTVPRVVGGDLVVATNTLNRQELRVRVARVTSVLSKDVVLKQAPAPGRRVDKSSTVTLTVSAGPGEALVPDVARLPRATARSKLADEGFKVVERKVPSADVRAGRAAGTSPPAASVLPRGAHVTLLVSTGPKRAKVPDVTGDPRSRAVARLTSVGFDVLVIERPSHARAGRVTSQTPAAGASAKQGTTVRLEVATPFPTVTVPSVTGKSEEAAAEALSRLGLEVAFRTRTVAAKAQADRVLSQDPAAGAKVTQGARVMLTVGKPAGA